MRRPEAAQYAAARRLLALETSEAEDAEGSAAVGARVHEKLFSSLASLVGTAGARALFARSTKLAATDFPSFRNADFNAEAPVSELLGKALLGEPPAVIAEASVALCATLLSLLATLIGEPLTTKVLQSVWPAFDGTNEETKR